MILPLFTCKTVCSCKEIALVCQDAEGGSGGGVESGSNEGCPWTRTKVNIREGEGYSKVVREWRLQEAETRRERGQRGTSRPS